MPCSHTPKRRLVGLCLSLLALAGLALGPAARADWLFSYPPNLIKLDSGHRNNVFYVGGAVQFTADLANYGTYNLQGTMTYEVRDYFGTVVDRGTALAPTPAGTSTLTVHVTQPGWYKLYVHEPNSVAPWGDSVGATTFVIFRNTPGFPLEPSPTLPNNSAGADGGDEVARGVTGMGPIRHEVQNAGSPAQDIATLQQALALDAQFYTPYDPQRPRPLLIAFPNGVGSPDPAALAADLAGLTKIVRQFHAQVKYWEPLNEPNGKYSGADYLNKELIPFYNAVKAVDPTCKVLGPAVVTVGPYGLNWLQGFFQAGGAKYIDAFSFHAYNNLNGDPVLARESLDALQALLAQYGVGGIEKWQTEQGYFAACYGAYEPRLQGRWTMLQMMLYEQYGIPKEHNHVWYDAANGFWSFPAFWENADGPYSVGGFNPAAALMRVWSEELSGANFASAYHFGALGDRMYLGDLFTGPGQGGAPGKQVAAFMSAGRTDGHVTLTVTGGGASLHVVSAFGAGSDLPVSGGQVVLPVPELPVYVEMAPGQSITVAPIDYGPDLALLPGVTATASGTGVSPLNPSNPNSISKIINGTLENWYWSQGPGDYPWMDNTPSFPAWVQITLPRPMPVSHVVVYAGVPWQNDGSLLDYELQYDKAGQWVTVDHVTEPANVVPFFTPADFTTVDSFYSDRCVFESDFAAVTTQRVRLLVHDATYGGAATAAVVAAGGQPGPHQVELREVELYNDGQAGGTAPPPTPAPTPAATGQVRYIPRTTCASRMVGGQFQGSADGVSYTTLYTITAAPPEGVWTTAALAVDPKQYRFLRYLAPNGAYGNIAELEFDSGTGAGAVKLAGTPFGTPGSYNNVGNDFTKVFDGDPTTFFDAPAPGNADFVGIDQAAAPAPAPAAPVNGASFVSQSVPSAMTAGQSYPVSVTLANTGTTTWTGAAAYSLGSQSPQDGSTWGLGRVPLPNSVAPGQSATFAFTVTAPSAAGPYPFQWRMVQDGVQWFGDFTPAATVAVAPAPTPAPAAPTGLTAAAGDGSIALTWNAVKGAGSYNLYRSTAAGQETPLAGGLTAPAYADTGLTDGANYYYVVTAVGPGGEGARSNEAAATPQAAPPSVTAVAASPASVTGRTTSLSALGADVRGESGLTYSWRATGPAPVTFSANGTNAAKNTVAAFTAAGAYAFRVTVTDALGESASGGVSVGVSQAPTAITVSPATASVTAGGTAQFSAAVSDQFGAALAGPALTWSVPGAAGVVGPGGLFTAAGSPGGPYAVTAFSAAVQATAAVTVTAPSAPSAPVASGSPPAPPSGLSAVAGSRQVSLHWGAVAGATSYDLYRATTSGKETLLVGGITTTGLTDGGLTGGASYYYWVTAVGPGGESTRSQEVSTYIN